jgi:hypothetical protein
MRSGAKAIEDDSEKRLAIPITVRQLEAVIRYDSKKLQNLEG